MHGPKLCIYILQQQNKTIQIQTEHILTASRFSLGLVLYRFRAVQVTNNYNSNNNNNYTKRNKKI